VFLRLSWPFTYEISKYSEINVKGECFWEHGNWFFQLRNSSGAKGPWRSAKIVRFEISGKLLTVIINLHFWRLTTKKTFFDGWRLNFRPFDGWQLTPLRASYNRHLSHTPYWHSAVWYCPSQLKRVDCFVEKVDSLTNAKKRSHNTGFWLSRFSFNRCANGKIAIYI